VRFPHYQLGTEAAQLLLERISGGEGPVKILFLAPELVVRGSTVERSATTAPADLDREDPEVADASPPPVPLRRPAARRARGTSTA
jgi:hypothetical protein